MVLNHVRTILSKKKKKDERCKQSFWNSRTGLLHKVKLSYFRKIDICDNFLQ